MITVFNSDRIIFDLGETFADIAVEFFETNNVKISTNNEGISLRDTEILKFITRLKAAKPAAQVTIVTANKKEDFPADNITVINNLHHLKKAQFYISDVEFIPSIKNKFGFFSRRASWDRLIIGAFLNQFHKSETLMSFHADITDANNTHTIGIQDVLFFDSASFFSVTSFLKECPVLLDREYSSRMISPESGAYELLSAYPRLFVDIVAESYITGESFFCTEKTARPIIGLTPFIVNGPKHYLQNLKELGFKTFSRWWSEQYDEVDGSLRVNRITQLIDDISQWDCNKKEQVLIDMHETLIHNLNTLKNL